MVGVDGCGAWSGWTGCEDGLGCADTKRCATASGLSVEQWSGDGTADLARGIAASADGAVLIVGRSNGKVEGQSAFGKDDAFLTGYKNGRMWTRQWGSAETDSAAAVASDDSNSAFVVGFTDGKLGAAQAGSRDVFLSKWRSDHTPAWTTQWGSDGGDEGAGVARGASGELWVCGRTSGALKGSNAGQNDAFVSKLSSEGSVLWSVQLGSAEAEDGNQVAVDASGNAFLVGTTGAKLGSDAALGGSDAFAAKIDTSGVVQWVRQWGTSSDDGAHDVVVLPGGDLMVVGFTHGMLSGATGTGGGFISRLDSEGRPRWTKQLGATNTDTANSLALSTDNRIYVGGVTAGAMVPNAAKGMYDAFLEARDLEGQVLWTKQAGTSGNEIFLAVAVDTTGTVYGVGSTQGSFPGFSVKGSSDLLLVVAPH
jgi:hypothetical protein